MYTLMMVITQVWAGLTRSRYVPPTAEPGDALLRRAFAQANSLNARRARALVRASKRQATPSRRVTEAWTR
jgi:hypothetical protein